jgi:hypothetical protein
MAKISMRMITNATTSQNWKKLKIKKHHTHISNYGIICFHNHPHPSPQRRKIMGLLLPTTCPPTTGQIVVAKLTMVQST